MTDSEMGGRGGVGDHVFFGFPVINSKRRAIAALPRYALTHHCHAEYEL
jgi:hypothetical protein